jgi:hypothetical protein
MSLHINKANHHINGENVVVLEVWRKEQEDGPYMLIVVIPLDDNGEGVTVSIGHPQLEQP